MSAKVESGDARRVERRAMWRWSGIIVGLLAMQIGLCVLGVVCAVRGGKAATVEANYYDKALHWDDQAALVRASKELGWTPELSVGDAMTTGGERALMIRLTNRDGTPVEGATFDVAYFHHAKPLELHRAQLRSTGGGLYAASVPLNRPGIWEFRLTAERAAEKAPEKFIATIQRNLP